jgi:hypothetical protein
MGEYGALSVEPVLGECGLLSTWCSAECFVRKLVHVRISEHEGGAASVGVI